MYDYLEQVTADVRDYVEQEIDLTEWAGDRDGLEEKLNDDLWTCDSVTGNASGSYYCNTWKAEEALAHKGNCSYRYLRWSTLSDRIRLKCSRFSTRSSRIILFRLSHSVR